MLEVGFSRVFLLPVEGGYCLGLSYKNFGLAVFRLFSFGLFMVSFRLPGESWATALLVVDGFSPSLCILSRPLI